MRSGNVESAIPSFAALPAGSYPCSQIESAQRELEQQVQGIYNAISLFKHIENDLSEFKNGT